MKSEEYVEKCVRTASGNKEEITNRLLEEGILDLLHAAIGISTEAAEVLDMLKKHIYYGKDLDLVNIEEELGDSNWYQSLMIHSMRLKKYSTSWEQIWEKNIAKLEQRYGQKFCSDSAINRDLKAERTILESNTKEQA
jgi:NTP pyrophosphatase (non-canonical NTP hydrolase)